MTLCDLCEHHKPASAFFCITHRVCRFCSWDFEEEIQECPSCVKRTLFGDSPEPAPPLLLPESAPPAPEIVNLVSPTPEPAPEPRMDATITSNPVPAPVPASQLQKGAAQCLGHKVDYNCHGCFTRYTRMSLAPGMIPRCSSNTCPLIRGRKRVLSQNSDCAAGFCTQSSTCIWRIKVGQKTAPTKPEPFSAPPRTPKPIEPAPKRPKKSAVSLETLPEKLREEEEQRRRYNCKRQAKYRNRLRQKKRAPSIPAEPCATTPESVQATPEPAGYQEYQESLLAKAQRIVDDMSTDSEMNIEPLCPYCGHQGHQEPECPAKASRIEATTNLYLAASTQNPVKTSALIKL